MKRFLKVHHVVDVGEFLVLAKELGINSGAIGGRESQIEENGGLLWFVEDSHLEGSEADSSSRRPLGVVSTSAEDGKGVELKELSSGQDGQWNLLVLVSDVKDRV